ncbi:hypothetical protein [Metaclostridioides mangenotii]|uniref:YtxH domain-containing protein n=1 Tax=Metaclostridioides mangenotii TaxID=1540 RepID=A0ABS4ECR8_9FIRM|nr:hypothetical protein [Clostridioides mangenotii]MBP1855749.1 hypothetical protein [Clostridioides mangenotii]
MEQIGSELINLGVVSVIAYLLPSNIFSEKKEDRDLYRQSVDTFTEVSRQFADSIQGPSSRIENVVKGTERIEQKLDNLINSREE